MLISFAHDSTNMGFTSPSIIMIVTPSPFPNPSVLIGKIHDMAVPELGNYFPIAAGFVILGILLRGVIQ